MNKPSALRFDYNIIIRSFNIKTGKTTKITKIHNLVVNSGLNWVRNLLGGAVSDIISYIGLGTDNTAVVAGDTVLGVEVERALGAITYPANYQIRITKTFTVASGTSHTVVEAGLFNQLVESGSIMFNRAVFSSHTLDVDNPLEVIITITASAV